MQSKKISFTIWQVIALSLVLTVCTAIPGTSIAEDALNQISTCSRDLGEGVSLKAIPTFNKNGGLVAATFVFRHTDGTLTVLKEGFHLRILPKNSFIRTSEIRIEVVKPIVSQAPPQQSTEMRVDLSKASAILNNADFIFTDGSVVKDNRVISIRPLRFASRPVTEASNDPACGFGPVLSERYEDVLARISEENDPIETIPQHLLGSWVIDTAATEKLVKKTLPRERLTEFLRSAGTQGFLAFHFEGQNLFHGHLTNVKDAKYQLVAQDGKSKTYFLRNFIQPTIDKNSVSTTIAVTVTELDKRNISIDVDKMPFANYLVWKKAQIDPSKKTPLDFKPEYDAWMGTLANIEKSINTSYK